MRFIRNLGSLQRYHGERFDADCAPKHVVGLRTSSPSVLLGRLGQTRLTLIWSRFTA